MAMQRINIKISGINPLLQNNPQTVDPFNRFSKAKKKITNKRTGKTDDDLLELGDIETESKIYFDDNLGVYVPATWLTESIITNGYAIAKIGRQKMRGGLFADADKIALDYRSKTRSRRLPTSLNPEFRHRMLLKQGRVRVPKMRQSFTTGHLKRC